MQDDLRKQWVKVCAEAAVCEDSARLEELTQQINMILISEKQRLDPTAGEILLSFCKCSTS